MKPYNLKVTFKNYTLKYVYLYVYFNLLIMKTMKEIKPPKFNHYSYTLTDFIFSPFCSVFIQEYNIILIYVKSEYKDASVFFLFKMRSF